MRFRAATHFEELMEPRAIPETTGFVCVDPEGKIALETLRLTADESIRACFGTNPDQRHIDKVASDGWRCLPITIAPR